MNQSFFSILEKEIWTLIFSPWELRPPVFDGEHGGAQDAAGYECPLLPGGGDGRQYPHFLPTGNF